LKGWAKNQVRGNRKKKKRLLEQLDNLDRKAELVLLSAQELEHKHCLTAELTNTTGNSNTSVRVDFFCAYFSKHTEKL